MVNSGIIDVMKEFNEIASYAEKMIDRKKAAQQKIKDEHESAEKYYATLAKARDERLEKIADWDREIESLEALRVEALTLQERRATILIKHRALLDEYETLPLDLNRFIGDWMAERGYDEMMDERYAIEDRLKTIEAEVGKIYYRRKKSE